MTAVQPFETSLGAEPHRPVDASSAHHARRALNARFTAVDGNDVALGHVHRPSWRGGIHMIGLAVAVPGVVALLSIAGGDTRFRLGLVVYAVGLCSMLGASTTYHRWVHGLKARCAWRRVDHAAIFGAIAGSSTPIVVAALPGATGFVLVGAIWSAAFLGACCKLSHRAGGDQAGTAMYAVTILLGTLAVPSLWAREGLTPAAFVIAGGIVYLFGAACFAKQWPRLRPTVFSFHEVWHVFTVIAAGSQFVAIWMLAT